MLKIGEFAKICNTTTQTLRYYDAEGVLCADKVDSLNSYRYYHPDKIKVYRQIVLLKDIGFSLDEIKIILSASEDVKTRMYSIKREELIRSIQNTNEMLSLLDTIRKDENVTSPTFERMLTDISFEDDPQIIGKWELCGTTYETDNINFENLKPSANAIYSTIYFLPNGAFYWGICWSRGIVYRLYPQYNLILPNGYSIVTHNKEKYMLLNWIDDECIENGSDSVLRVYRQVDSIAYSEIETHIGRDNVSLPFEPDTRLKGIWEVCSFIRSPDELDTVNRHSYSENLYVLEMYISVRGECIKTLRGPNGRYKKMYSYTKGVILDKANEFAEKYFFREIGDTVYLIVEHKSGDYQFTGNVYGYYVFKKKENENK